MALMERKREKKVKGSTAKPAKQIAPAPDEMDLAEPVLADAGDLAGMPMAKNAPDSATSKRKPQSLVDAAAGSAGDAEESSSPEAIFSPPRPDDLFIIKKETPALRPSTRDLAFAVPEKGANATVASDTTADGESENELDSVEYEDLTDIEKDILLVAKASLKKKRNEADIGFEPFTPMVEKIVNDCLAKYHAQKGYSKEAIIETIKGLAEQKWIVTAERRTRDEILGTKLYQDIIKMLEDYPGTHARDDRIQAILGITRNPFLKHMLVLERFDLVQKRKFGKLWNFFPPSFKEDDTIAELVVVLYNDIVRQLVRLLMRNPCMTLVELAETVIPPVYHGAIQYHLKRLEELGFVKSGGTNRVIDADILQRYNAVVCDALKILS